MSARITSARGDTRTRVTIKDGTKVEGECLPTTDIKKNMSMHVIDKKIFKSSFLKKINTRERIVSGSKRALIKKLFTYIPIPVIGMKKNKLAIHRFCKLILF